MPLTRIQSLGITDGTIVNADINASAAIVGTKISNLNDAKAWVNFNGIGTVAIRASYNVSSITDNGTGDYTVNLTTALTDANYSIVGSTSMDLGVAYNGAVSINTINATAAESAPTTTAFRLAIRNSGATAMDVKYFNVAVFR